MVDRPRLPTQDRGNPAPIRSPLEAVRRCKSCGKEAKIVSNHVGVIAHCYPCKQSWPVSLPVAPAVPVLPSRGLHKVTLVEPDWNLALDD